MAEKLIAAMQMSTPIVILAAGLVGAAGIFISAMINEKPMMAWLAVPLLWATITLFGALVM
jgi:hypothetical protein